jgi:hypothetical protein
VGADVYLTKAESKRNYVYLLEKCEEKHGALFLSKAGRNPRALLRVDTGALYRTLPKV